MSTFTLYRFYNDESELLYVGLSINPGKRFERHKTEKPWWDDIAHIDLEHFDNLDELRAAERTAIQTERPEHNIRMSDRPRQLTADEQRETLEAFGWECVHNDAEGLFLAPWSVRTPHTRHAAWTQLQR
jgi:predicted GIY-YIG superfamily endonuclease